MRTIFSELSVWNNRGGKNDFTTILLNGWHHIYQHIKRKFRCTTIDSFNKKRKKKLQLAQLPKENGIQRPIPLTRILTEKSHWWITWTKFAMTFLVCRQLIDVCQNTEDTLYIIQVSLLQKSPPMKLNLLWIF